MNITVLDFETYYDQQFSLKKLTIPQYVHDPRFHIHGLAIRWSDARSEFRTDVDGAIADLQAQLGRDLESTTVVCHHAQFDLYILAHRFGIHPRFFVDTMLLSYHVDGRPERGEGESASLKALAERYRLQRKGDLEFMRGVRNPSVVQWAELSAYAKRDVEITADLAELLLPQITRPEVELPILMHAVRLFTGRGVQVDVAGIDAVERHIRQDTTTHLNTAGMTPESATHNGEFAAALERALARTGRKTPLKPGKRGLIPAIAKTDPAMRALLEDDDPVVAALVRARLQKKGEDQQLARLRTLREIAGATGETLPPCLVYYGAHTGRFAGGGKFNLQNLARSGAGAKIRSLLTARPGHVLIGGDLAQIEARITAWLAGQQDMLDIFKQDRDFYCEVASSILKQEVRKPRHDDPPPLKDRLEAYRKVGKEIVLGLGFGMGAMKFMNRLRMDKAAAALFDCGELSPAICRDIVRDYRERYPMIPVFWSELDRAFRLAVDGVDGDVGRLRVDRAGDITRIWLPSGRALRFSNLRLESAPRTIIYLDDWGEEAEFTPDEPALFCGRNTVLYGGKLCENVAQAVARDVLVEAVLRLEARGFPVLFHVHDEVVVEAPKDRALGAESAVIEELSRVPDWAESLPIACEVRSMERYRK